MEEGITNMTAYDSTCRLKVPRLSTRKTTFVFSHTDGNTRPGKSSTRSIRLKVLTGSMTHVPESKHQDP